MPRNDSQFFGRELAQIKKAIADLKSGRLQNASMHGARIYVYDDEGDVREVIGNQGDGSYGSRVILSPPQPTPTAPILPAADGDERVATVFAVRWDGGIVQGVVPVVHGRVDVWTQKLAQGEEPDPSAAVLSGSIRDQQGGVTDVVVQGAGNYAVWLQMVGADRVTKGEFSQPAVVDVTALVDTERLEGALQGDLPDGIYNSLMARLAEFLYVRADQLDVNSLAADTARMNELWAGLAVISEAQIDSVLGNSAKFKTIESAEIRGGTISTAEGVNGRVNLRRYGHQEIYGGTPTPRMLAGMGFESDTIPRVAGAFVQEDDGRVVLSSGTGGDSTNGRPYGYMAGGWEAQWLRPRDRLETFNNCIVGRPVTPSLENNFQSPISGEQPATFTRLGDWVMLSGGIRKGNNANWSGTMMFTPAPSFDRRISTSIAGSSAANIIPFIIMIDTFGRVSVVGGVNQTNNFTLSLDGLIYKL